MAEKKLSPRQRMINMMYLVLTALLALNVSKEVLNSFFEVNTGIERTTTNFATKNNEVYTAFDNAVFNNPEKFKSVRDDAYTIKNKADALVETIQEMKYSLVLDVDGGVTIDNITIDGTEIDLSSGDLTLDVAGSIDLTSLTEVKSDTPLKIKEAASAIADTAAYGQLWV